MMRLRELGRRSEPPSGPTAADASAIGSGGPGDRGRPCRDSGRFEGRGATPNDRGGPMTPDASGKSGQQLFRRVGDSPRLRDAGRSKRLRRSGASGARSRLLQVRTPSAPGSPRTPLPPEQHGGALLRPAIPSRRVRHPAKSFDYSPFRRHEHRHQPSTQPRTRPANSARQPWTPSRHADSARQPGTPARPAARSRARIDRVATERPASPAAHHGRPPRPGGIRTFGFGREDPRLSGD
jgi:hypothetical protein